MNHFHYSYGSRGDFDGGNAFPYGADIVHHRSSSVTVKDLEYSRVQFGHEQDVQCEEEGAEEDEDGSEPF